MPGIPKLSNKNTLVNTHDLNKIINQLNGLLIRNTDAIQTVNATTATTSIDLSSTNSVILNLNVSTTVTLSNYTLGVYTFSIIQSGTKTLTITNCKTPSGANGVISVTSTAGAKDLLTIVCDGTNLFGTIEKAFA